MWNCCYSLWKVLNKFSIKIFRHFNINILDYPTLSSLAFGIYRVNFLKTHKIPLITGKLYHDLKLAYTGGSVDVYKPSGDNIYRYDVNSVYPFSMKNFKSPVGNIERFTGNIWKIDPNAFGFFYVKVKSPDNLNVPILQVKSKTPFGGIRTIAPLGSWEGI